MQISWLSWGLRHLIKDYPRGKSFREIALQMKEEKALVVGHGQHMSGDVSNSSSSVMFALLLLFKVSETDRDQLDDANNDVCCCEARE